MSREIDERIVAMYFDNSNFERNASKTLKTLEELKNSVDMSNLEQGMDAFGKAKEQLNLDKVNRSMSTFKKLMSGFGKTLAKVYVSPFESMFKGLDNFRKNYLNKIIGFDVAKKIETSLENAFRTLTVAPVSKGWQQYETTMDSVKTIMSSTGADIDTVKAKLGELTAYANQTIYSLSDMTSNLGKFTNNGVALDEATRAMIGLANATADAGQGAQQASMAMYNVSQAIGVGKMTTIDWKSLENANIATIRLKETLMETAMVTGQLERRLVNGETQYWTVAREGRKAVQVTAQNFRDTLSEGWLDKDAMLKAFSIYSGELSELEIRAFGFSREDAARLAQIGRDAKEAAEQVRTLDKMMESLAEAAQSKWAESFEFIFGDMEEGTNLWTELSGKIEGVMDKGFGFMQDLLISWRGMMRDDDGQVRRIEDVYKRRQEMLLSDLEAGYITLEEFERRKKELDASLGDQSLWVDYRDMLKDSFFGLLDVFGTLGGAVKAAWKDAFGEMDTNPLKKITQVFHDLVDRVKEWLGSLDDSDSRISRIRRALAGVFRIVKIVWTVFKGAVGFLWKVVEPIIQPLLTFFEKIGDWLNLGNIGNLGDFVGRLGDKFRNLWDTLKKLGWKGVFQKIGTWIGDLWTNIKTSVGGWMRENGLGGIVDWVVKAADDVKEWWNADNNILRIVFEEIYRTISGLFEPDEKGETPIGSFFGGIIDTITAKIEEIKKWWEDPNNVVRNIFDTIVGWIKRQFTVNKDTGTTPIGEFFSGILSNLRKAKQDIEDWWNSEGNGIRILFQSIWNTVTGWFKPQDKDLSQAMASLDAKLRIGHISVEEYDSRKASLENSAKKVPIVQFFENLYDGIVGTWDKIVAWWYQDDNFIRNLFDEIATTVTGWFTPNDGGEIPIVRFFNNCLEKIREAWAKLVEFFQTGDGAGIGQFLTDAWDWILDLLGLSNKQRPDASKADDLAKKVGTTIETFNRGVASAAGGASEMQPGEGLVAMAETVSMEMTEATQILTDTQTQVAQDLDIDPEAAERSPIIQFFLNVYDGICKAWDAVSNWEGWASVGQFFQDVWGWLSQTVTTVWQSLTEKKDVPSNEELHETEDGLVETKSFLDTIFEFIGSIFTKISEWFVQLDTNGISESIINAAGSMLNGIVHLVEIVAGWFERVVGKIQGKPDSETGWTDADWIVPAIGVILLIAGKIYEYKKLGRLAQIAETGSWMSSIGGEFLKLAAAIGIVALAVNYLGTMDPDSMWRGIGAIVAISGVIAGIMIITKFFGSTVQEQTAKPVSGLERVVSKIIVIGGLIGAVWLLFEELPPLMDKLAEVKAKGVDGEDILNVLLGITTVISGLMLGLALMNKVLPKGIDIAAAAKASIALWVVIGISIISVFGTGGLFEIIGAAMYNIKATANGTEGGNILAGDIPDEDLNLPMQKMVEWSGYLVDILGNLGEGLGNFVLGLTGIPGLIKDVIHTGTEATANADAIRTEANTASFASLVTLFSDKDDSIFGPIYRVLAMVPNLSDKAANLKDADFSSFTGIMVDLSSGILALYDAFDSSEFKLNHQGFDVKSDETRETFKSAFELVNEMLIILRDLRWEDFNTKNIDRFSTTFGDDTPHLGPFISALTRIIRQINELTSYINEDTLGTEALQSTVELLHNFFDTLISLSETGTGKLYGNRDLTGAIPAFISWFGNEENVKTFFGAIRNIVNEANGLPELKAKAIASDVYDMIESALSLEDSDRTFDGTPVVQAILDAINLGDTEIGRAVARMVQHGIDLLTVGEKDEFGLDATELIRQFTEGSGTDFSGIGSGMLDFLYGLADPNNTNGINALSGEIETTFTEMGKKLSTQADEVAGKLGEVEAKLNATEERVTEIQDRAKAMMTEEGIIPGLSLTMEDLFADTDEDGVYDWMASITGAFNTMEDELGETDLRFRPVIVLDDFGGELEQLRTMVSNEAPLALNATLDIGETKLNIDDTSIVSEIRGFRESMAQSQIALRAEIRVTNTNLANRIDDLGTAISNLNLMLDTGKLVGGLINGIDTALYDRSMATSKTGVSYIP